MLSLLLGSAASIEHSAYTNIYSMSRRRAISDQDEGTLSLKCLFDIIFIHILIGEVIFVNATHIRRFVLHRTWSPSFRHGKYLVTNIWFFPLLWQRVLRNVQKLSRNVIRENWPSTDILDNLTIDLCLECMLYKLSLKMTFSGDASLVNVFFFSFSFFPLCLRGHHTRMQHEKLTELFHLNGSHSCNPVWSRSFPPFWSRSFPIASPSTFLSMDWHSAVSH